MRLDKYICDNLEYSRSEIKKIIKNKKVMVNDKIIIDTGYSVNEGDVVKVAGEIVTYKHSRYFLLNKPSGYITATEDDDQKCVMDLINEVNKSRLFPVGRLDKDTEGLLLITDDGALAHNLLAPSKHVAKTYYIQAHHELSKEEMDCLESGIDIGDEKITAKATIKQVDSLCYHLTITEGRYHQVKRMFKAVDNEVLFLKRISFGKLKLPDDLGLGKYIEIDKKDII